MKTLVFRNSDSTTRVQIYVDIFASNEDIVVEGFETRFTNMSFEGLTNAAITMGITNQQIENSFQNILTVARRISGVGLFAFDDSYPNLSAQAQVDTITLSGTSGTANVNVGGTDYVATFSTDLTTTAANFVTTHAATILSAHGVVVTSSGADIILTANVAGTPFTSSIANATTDLDGTLVNTTLNQGGGGEITLLPTHHPVVTN